MALERRSPCKVNFILNILGKRADGYHELETVMHPVGIFDLLTFEKNGSGIQLTCSDPALPVDTQNLVYRAAEKFFTATNLPPAVRINLQKNIPLEAGMGGGSSNAAHTLLGLNELFATCLTPVQLHTIAAALGSDVPFFLQENPAIAFGRGEKVEALPPFSVLEGMYLFLVHPGFGVSTPWAYKKLARFPSHLNGEAGRARLLADALIRADFAASKHHFYNSLEAPALEKYPILQIFQQFMRAHRAPIAMMSGSGSTTFAIVENKHVAEKLAEEFKGKFGNSCWQKVVPL
jgi:4-diphosphocytidyl-2-C-methyl-D-erythritol kinase